MNSFFYKNFTGIYIDDYNFECYYYYKSSFENNNDTFMTVQMCRGGRKMKPYVKVKRVFALCLMIGAVILFGAGEYIQYVNVTTISKKDALADYDYMWKVLEGNYPFLKMAERKTGLSMDTLKMTYRDKIEATGKRRINFCDYYELMRECIGKFRGLAHLGIYNPYMYQDHVTEVEAAKQMDFYNDLLQWRLQFYHDPSVRKRYDYLAGKYSAGIMAQNEESAPNLTFQEISTDIAYVKIDSFAAGNMLKDQDILYKWFSENAHKKNIIIDITGNGGGSDWYWMNLLVAPNIDKTLSCTSYFITPYGEESREQFALCGVEMDDLNPNLEDLLKLPKLNREDLSEVKYYKTNSVSVSPVSDKKICDGRR